MPIDELWKGIFHVSAHESREHFEPGYSRGVTMAVAHARDEEEFVNRVTEAMLDLGVVVLEVFEIDRVSSLLQNYELQESLKKLILTVRTNKDEVAFNPIEIYPDTDPAE